MCTVCGCGEGEVQTEGDAHQHPHDHQHEHSHGHGPASYTRAQPSALAPRLDFGAGPAHAHVPGMSQQRMIQVEQDILAKNDAYAAENRRYLAARGVFAVNLVSSPGSGKTSLLVRTIDALGGRIPVSVIEGDQQTSHDADRIRATGVVALQINTGKGCHLDAHMVGHALEHLQPPESSVVMIENVGNLVCPSAFDLGEAHKVVILSVTEGDDKPLKYPDMFHAARLMLLNKIDLLPYVDFDVDRCVEYARRVNPDIQVLQLSARSGAGLEAWVSWLEAGLAAAVQARDRTVEALERRNAGFQAELAALRARLGDPA